MGLSRRARKLGVAGLVPGRPLLMFSSSNRFMPPSNPYALVVPLSSDALRGRFANLLPGNAECKGLVQRASEAVEIGQECKRLYEFSFSGASYVLHVTRLELA